MVFRSIVELCTPQVLGKDAFDIDHRVRDLRSLCDYWSLQGAARHAISAFEIALQDAKGKSLGKPVYDLLGGAKAESIADLWQRRLLRCQAPVHPRTRFA